MRPTILLCLLSFCGCLPLGLIECIQQCGPNLFYVTWPNGSFKSCLHCSPCHPGWGLHPNCGERITYPPQVECKRCEYGTFSELYDSSRCKSCHFCAQHEIVTQDCTPRSDTLCSGTCVQGYFYHNSTRDCQKCSHCCNAGEDEKQQECINQGLHVIHCAPRPDKQCGPASTTNREQQHTVSKLALILSCVGIIIAVLLGAGFAYCVIRICRRRIRRRNERYNAGNCASDAVIVLSTNDGSQRMVHPPRFEGMQLQNVGYESCNSTPYESRKVTASHADERPLKRQNRKEDKKEQNVQDDVGQEMVHMPRLQGMQLHNIGYESRNSTPNESRRETAFHADDESMVVKDKPYKREKKEKNGNSYPPFTIEEHPKTQTQQEDSRVELKCIVKGKPKEVIYQWFKDEEELPEEKSPSLIRDPLKVKHFGSYKCELRSCDADQHNLSFVTSHTAELDVTPSVGTRYSLLEEVFKENFNTREKVEKLLCKEISGCPAWKQVASSYKHEDLSSFARCKNPGEEVIDFLLSSNPNLSVYNFCKKLKEKSIRRLDIVAALEDFLVQNDGRPNGVGKI
ncbi:uncharacterized protein [Montipora foliosa]|uniref:uncharacterized protein n=1 Tax=Montipora foliosa TaxID=591990 RepID=UPI0035F2129E